MITLSLPGWGTRRAAPLRWWQRFVMCCAGAFAALGTVAHCAQRALDAAALRVRAALAAGGTFDAESEQALARLASFAALVEPVAQYPALAVALALGALAAGLCALAAWRLRRGGPLRWLAVAFVVPCGLAFAVWHAVAGHAGEPRTALAGPAAVPGALAPGFAPSGRAHR